MGTEEDAFRNNVNVTSDKQKNLRKKVNTSTSSLAKSQIKRKPNQNHRNFKQIFILSFDALRERKTKSILTILMVVAGGALMVALNGMSAGVADLINKQEYPSTYCL